MPNVIKQEFEYERYCYYCGALSTGFKLRRVTTDSGQVFVLPIYHCDDHQEVSNA